MNRPSEDELRDIRQGLAQVDFPSQSMVRLFAEIDTLRSELEAEGDRFKESIPCAICGKPVIFEFTVESVVWNRIVRAKGLPEYLCFWCFDRLADEEKVDRRIPVGVNINGIVAFSNWCEEDVPNAYPNEKTKAQLRSELEAARADIEEFKRIHAEAGRTQSLELENHKLRRKLAEAQREALRLGSELLTAKDAIPSRDITIREQATQIADLEKQLADSEQSYLDLLSQERDKWLNEKLGLEKQLADARQIISDADLSGNFANEVIGKQEADIEALRTTQKRLVEQVEDLMIRLGKYE